MTRQPFFIQIKFLMKPQICRSSIHSPFIALVDFFYFFFIQQDENGNNDKLLLIQERTRRFTGSTLLLVLASLCLACMGVLIGLVIYRRVQLQRMHFHGMCNLPYDGQFDQNRDMLNMLNQRYQELDL